MEDWCQAALLWGFLVCFCQLWPCATLWSSLKLLNWDTKEGENICTSSFFAARAQDGDKVTLYLYLPLEQASCRNGLAPRWEQCLHLRVSAASVILVLRAKRHKGSSVDSLPAEKKRPLLIFRFEPFRPAPVAPPTFDAQSHRKGVSGTVLDHCLLKYIYIYIKYSCLDGIFTVF